MQAFVNTVDLEDGREDFTSPADLHAWFVRHELVDAASPATLTDGDVQTAIELREAIRSLLIGNAGGQVDSRALEIINHRSAAARIGLSFTQFGTELQPLADGIDGALGRLLIMINQAMADGQWERLKACQSEPCRWAYYDTSRNRSGSWCSMTICGNKAKTRSYRARQRTTSRQRSAANDAQSN